MERVVLAAGADVLLAGMLLLSLAIPPVSMPSFPWSRSFSCAGEGQRTFLVLTAVRVVLGVGHCSGELAETRHASGLGRWESWESFLWLPAGTSSMGRSQLQGRCPSAADIGIPLRQKVLGWITAAESGHQHEAWNSSLRQPAARLWIGLERRAACLALAQTLVQS